MLSLVLSVFVVDTFSVTIIAALCLMLLWQYKDLFVWRFATNSILLIFLLFYVVSVSMIPFCDAVRRFRAFRLLINTHPILLKNEFTTISAILICPW